ncbi:bifunctional nicotinamide-nucleotide adenylyltransferase/Nudix hydroxylase [Marinicella meishanensis]|uniref:bifunctional nicotinamide-nucleotide adenylyltransferase/Nudix hydroxylase n=1 Tax=Marinicella meishanensis TaxID=2873263 RepID=UPI001CBB81E6|nr:bifunctional nicotinamide-nucleotide adenylyltransferase/Nudix hydroxylase [Marinicella sp. NBU2979]
MPKQFDFLVFIGRFQPFHSGHLKVVQKALTQADKLIVLIGSAHQPRSLRNPWQFDERDAMMRACLSTAENQQLITAPLMDVTYNDELWVKNVQSTIQGLVTAHFTTPHKHPRIGLIGHSKDHSSYYLNLFPQWGSVAVDDYLNINATPIRNALLAEKETVQSTIQQLQTLDHLPPAVADYLVDFSQNGHRDVFHHLCDEFSFIQRYKQGWEVAPYQPTFVTVDAVVVQSGHILLVERKASPGKGLLALPGGFVDGHETLKDACIRELKEETKLKVPVPVLYGSIRHNDVFDDPYRSMRGRTITHAFYIELKPNQALPKVKGGDDAKQAFWLPLSELDPAHLFEDHYFIIQKMIGQY